VGDEVRLTPIGTDQPELDSLLSPSTVVYVGLFSWLLTGLVVGMIARLLVRGRHALGCFGTIGLGMIGSLVGGTALNVLTGNGFDLAGSGFFGSVFGAVLLLVLVRIFGNSPQQTQQLP
jgi:uncharacterized membrane protein YeaQ/YmgE (transglycosylase-associated protein family)